MFILKWLRAYGYKKLIQQMDELEQPFAEKIKEAQSKLGEIPPEEFAKQVVDDIQRLLCRKLNIDPKEIGL